VLPSAAPLPAEQEREECDVVMRGPSGRLARRLSLGFPVILERVLGTGPKETTHTENVSPLGMQVLTMMSWQTREEAIVSIDQTGYRRDARAIYCVARDDGKFIVGFALKGPPINWASISKAVAD
jgi:hypothetical protein